MASKETQVHNTHLAAGWDDRGRDSGCLAAAAWCVYAPRTTTLSPIEPRCHFSFLSLHSLLLSLYSRCKAPRLMLSRGYWTSPTSDLAAPAVGLVRSATDYSHTQRVSLMYYTYFNRVVTQRKLRHFPRKTAEANLRSPEGEAPVHHPDTIMPRLATQGMLYDLIPASAATNGQLGVRCQRPDGTLSAAAANRARREQELFKWVQRGRTWTQSLTPPVTPRPPETSP